MLCRTIVSGSSVPEEVGVEELVVFVDVVVGVMVGVVVVVVVAVIGGEVVGGVVASGLQVCPSLLRVVDLLLQLHE